MKKFILSAITIFVFAVIGCNTSSSDPKGVLKNFVEALGKKDIEGAKKYATKDSEAMLGMMQMALSMAPKDTKDSIYNKDNMDFGDAKIEGDKATVPVKNKKSDETTVYTLKKEDGAWKVAFDKATMGQMGADKMKDMKNNNMDMNNGMDSATKMLEDLNKMNNENKSNNKSSDDSAQ